MTQTTEDAMGEVWDDTGHVEEIDGYDDSWSFEDVCEAEGYDPAEIRDDLDLEPDDVFGLDE